MNAAEFRNLTFAQQVDEVSNFVLDGIRANNQEVNFKNCHVQFSIFSEKVCDCSHVEDRVFDDLEIA